MIDIHHTFEHEAIKNVVKTLVDDVVEDGCDHLNLDDYIDVKKDCWVECWHDHVIIGYVHFKPYNLTAMEIHPFIRKEHRDKSYHAIKAAIRWFDTLSPDMYKSLITNVPACKRYAVIFALKMGFKKVGCYKNAFKRYNKLHDMVLFQRARVL